MAPSPVPGDVGGLVVTYEPNLDLLEQVLGAVRIQVTRLIVVDNGSSNLASIRDISERVGASLVANPSNLGLAAALNIGSSKLCQGDAVDWVLIVDQDTIPPAGYAGRLLTLLRENDLDDPRVWVVRGVEGAPSRTATHGKRFRYIRAAIMSGSLVRVEALRVTRFREEFFVDLVDSDFYYQVAEQGHKVVRFESVIAPHTVGTVIDLKDRPTSYESSRRTYYIARNGCILVLEGRFDAKLPWVIVSSVLPVAYVEGFRTALRSLLGGLRDGFVRRTRSSHDG